MALWRDLMLDPDAGEPRVFDFKGESDRRDFGPIVDRIYSAGRATADADTLLAELRMIVVSREAAARPTDADEAGS